MTAKEIQDISKQDSDANANRVNVRKYSNRNANRSGRKVDEKAQEESRGERKGGKRTCWRCGLKQCPAFGKICGKCLKKNHFACACRSDKVSAKKVNQVGDSSDEEDSDDEYVKKVTIGWMSTDTGKKTTLKLFLNGVKAQKAIDSGASANIIDEGRLRKI